MNRGGGHQASTFQTNARSEPGQQISAYELRETRSKCRPGALKYVAHILTVITVGLEREEEGIMINYYRLTDYLKQK